MLHNLLLHLLKVKIKEKEKQMNALTLIEAILALVPQGLTLTSGVLNLFKHTTNAVNATPGSPEHTAAVTAIAQATTSGTVAAPPSNS